MTDSTGNAVLKLVENNNLLPAEQKLAINELFEFYLTQVRLCLVQDQNAFVFKPGSEKGEARGWLYLQDISDCAKKRFIFNLLSQASELEENEESLHSFELFYMHRDSKVFESQKIRVVYSDNQEAKKERFDLLYSQVLLGA